VVRTAPTPPADVGGEVSEVAPAGGGGGRWGFGHVPALDGLRGAAVVAVLLYHGGHLTGGYLGVDLFFVLSGYLITSLLLAEHRTNGSIDLGAFWARRARRLLPAVLVLLAGIAVYAWVVARPIDLGQIRADGLATLFYAANWHAIARGGSYWDISLAPSPLQHTWSLAIEEQFYLLWPLVVVGLARRSGALLERSVGRLAIGLSAVSVGLFVGLHLHGSSDTRVYEGTDTRAAALLLGVALAAYGPRLRARLAGVALEAVGLLAAVALAGLWLRLEGTSPWLYRGGLPLASVLGVLVLVAASDAASPMLGRVLSFAPLRWVGLISYGLYLWHWPIYQAIDQRNGRLPGLGGTELRGAALLAVKLGLSLAVAVASYVVVEQPVRRGALRGRAGIGVALGGMAVAGLLVVVSTTGAIAVPGEGDVVGQADTEVAGAPTVLFVGDSVAQSLVRPVVADPDRYGVNPVNRTRPGCSVVTQGRKATNFAGVPSQPAACLADPADTVRRAHPDVVLVLLGARPNDYIQAPDGRWVRACDPAFDRAYRESTRSFLRELGSSGATLVVGTVLRSGANALPVEGAEERIACVDRVLAALADEVPNGELLDLNDLVCPDGPGTCVEELGGDPIRSDGLHYDDGPGGARVADWAVERALELAGLEASKPGG
jgi:peptidoglycan/LPS O-acetylase OafA/YrhL